MHNMNFWFLVVLVLPIVTARGPYNNLGDIFEHQLADLPDHPPSTRPPQHGGGNYRYCCLKAVNESLEIQDGYLQFRPGQTHLRGTASEFLRHQFPCGAKYNGSLGEPSQVFLSYSWCHENCPGWMITGVNTSALVGWARLLVVFIVPAVIFSLSISRRRRLILPPSLFPRSIPTAFEAWALIVKIPLASLLAVIDITVWMGFIVTMAGPMIVSGLFEATLDFRILRFLRKRIEINSMTVRERAHLLLLILIGNLDLNPAWKHSRQLVSSLPHESLRNRLNSQSTAVESNASPHLAPQTSTATQVTEAASQSSTQSGRRPRLKEIYPHNIQAHIQRIGSQLSSLLEAQPSFGSTTGVAVVFYTVSFIFSLIELSENPGLSEVAHTIANAMFWMVIPHVSIISSLLLASNNPSTWTAITAADQHLNAISISPSPMTQESTSDGDRRFNWKQLWSIDAVHNYTSRTKRIIFPYVYGTPYTTAWLWDRGISKYYWICRYQEEYPHLVLIADEVLRADMGTCVNILVPALFLVIIPSFLAGMISYATPATGLSCKSMMHLLYAVSQTIMASLWLYHLLFRKRASTIVGPRVSRMHRYFRLYLEGMWYLLFILSLVGAFFTSILGTCFYNNCLCYLPIWHWRHRFTSPEAQFYVGGNSAQKIYNARHYWIPVGTAGTALLVVMSYIGWWYQKHHRQQFKYFAERLGHINEQDMHENGERVGFDTASLAGIELRSSH